MTRRERMARLLHDLPLLYPEAACLLQYGGSPWKLLVATVLSAQTTDAAVNRVTPVLWKDFPDLEALSSADTALLEEILHPLGFFRAKARSVTKAAAYLIAEHSGEVPATMEELVRVPGVGRKTASVVLGEAFGQPAIIVDTHVKRLSGRLDLSRKPSPDDIERELVRQIPPDRRTGFSHQLGFHGRQVCHAKKPSCTACSFAGFCPRRGIPRI
jgi:endonuclease-3